MSMAIPKVSYLAFLLLFGMMSHVEHADAKGCTKNCDTRLAYEICPRPETSTKVDLNQICTNCCAGRKGCSYFSEDGTFICKGESDPENPKACPRNCDPRIAYGICPLSENKKPKLNQLCTNCCAGRKGCSYFSEDGTFICKGESDPENPKACPRNCDPRIAYGICPLSENKKPKLDKLCTNCCAGKKGCYYYNADRDFVCEGGSEYVSDFQKIKVAVS